MTNIAAVNVSGLEMLECVVDCAKDPQLSPYPMSCGLYPGFFQSIRRLNIILRLPLSLFTSQLHMWARLWPALIDQLKQLQELMIWLDNDDKSPWSLVNERSLLSPLTEAISAEIGHILEHISVNLPLLHPRSTDPERHFTKKEPLLPSNLMIRRNLRQTYYGEENTAGQLRVKSDRNSEFAFLVDVADMPDWGFTSLEEVVELAQELWEGGRDLEAEIVSLGPF
jgi:hypothetical protein